MLRAKAEDVTRAPEPELEPGVGSFTGGGWGGGDTSKTWNSKGDTQ